MADARCRRFTDGCGTRCGRAAARGTPGGRSVGLRSVSTPTPDPDGEPSRLSEASRALRVGLWLPVDGMDPAIATYRTSRLVTEQLYSTLMALGPDGRPYPDLAAWIEVSDDALTYTFGLVEGVRFHDGSPLTADDVAFTFKRLLEMGEAYHFDPWVATIAGADVVDPHTVRIRLSQPTGPILTWLAFCGTGIVPRAAIESGRDLMREPIGSGPFRLAEPWAGGDAPIRLVAHDASARGGSPSRATPRRLDFHAIPSADERAAALLVGPHRPRRAARSGSASTASPRSPGLVAHETPDSRWHWLVVNCRQAPLGDLRVRRAITLALDRESFSRRSRVWARRSPAASSRHGRGPRRRTLPRFRPWRPRRGARLLAEARRRARTRAWRSSRARACRSRSGRPNSSRRQLRAVGLDAAASVVDGATYAARVSRDGDFQLATSYWGSPIWDPDDFVWMGFRSGARYDAGSCSSSALDAFMERGRGSIDQAGPTGRIRGTPGSGRSTCCQSSRPSSPPCCAASAPDSAVTYRHLARNSERCAIPGWCDAGIRCVPTTRRSRLLTTPLSGF